MGSDHSRKHPPPPAAETEAAYELMMGRYRCGVVTLTCAQGERFGYGGKWFEGIRVIKIHAGIEERPPTPPHPLPFGKTHASATSGRAKLRQTTKRKLTPTCLNVCDGEAPCFLKTAENDGSKEIGKIGRQGQGGNTGNNHFQRISKRGGGGRISPSPEPFLVSMLPAAHPSLNSVSQFMGVGTTKGAPWAAGAQGPCGASEGEVGGVWDPLAAYGDDVLWSFCVSHGGGEIQPPAVKRAAGLEPLSPLEKLC